MTISLQFTTFPENVYVAFGFKPTQLAIKLPSIERYMATSLGNHQVLSYGDYGAALRSAADILHLTFLN